MISDKEEKKVLERLQRQCARAESCTADVRRKALKALEGDAEAADRIVLSLVEDRFVDDRRYAGAFARAGGWRDPRHGRGRVNDFRNAILGRHDLRYPN